MFMLLKLLACHFVFIEFKVVGFLTPTDQEEFGFWFILKLFISRVGFNVVLC